MRPWERLEGIATERLTAARLQLHWAFQPVAALGKLLLPHQPDFSEQSFCWRPEARSLAQGTISRATPSQPALRLAPPALLLLDAAGGAHRTLPLPGRTLDEAYRW